jgi:hypothetical protein
LQQVASPEWVQTYREWSAWVLEYGHGVPAREYLALLIELEQAQERLEAARKVGDSEEEQVQREAVLNAGHRWSTFL